MKTLTESFHKQESVSFQRHRETLQDQLKKISNTLQTVKGKEDASEKNLNSIWTIVKEVQERLANELSVWSEKVQADLEGLCSEIESTGAEHFATVCVFIRDVNIGSFLRRLRMPCPHWGAS